MKGVNIGCGISPTEGWSNYDNSKSVLLAKIPFFTSVLYSFGVLNKRQRDFSFFARNNNIKFADVCKRIPEPDHSVDVLYSSHMLEHLDSQETQAFLAEAMRVLKPGGYIRLALPDLRNIVDDYLKSGDADMFMNATGLSRRRSPKTFLSRIKYLLIGDRGHKYLYDGASLCKLLTFSGFKDVKVMPEGETMIPEPGALNLAERSPFSVYVESVNP